MKKGMIAAMVTTLAAGSVVGCQSFGKNENIHANIPITYEQLEGYDWQLIQSTQADGRRVEALFYDAKKPLILDFKQIEVSNTETYAATVSGGHRLLLKNTCNGMGTDYRIEERQVVLGHMLSTMKACPEAQMRFDEAAVQAVSGRYDMGKNEKGVLTLTVSSENQISYYQAIKNQ